MVRIGGNRRGGGKGEKEREKERNRQTIEQTKRQTCIKRDITVSTLSDKWGRKDKKDEKKTVSGIGKEGNHQPKRDLGRRL